MTREPIVGGCTFNRWRYATWPLVWATVEDRGLRIGARLWPVLRFGFLDVDRSLIEFSRQDRSALILWASVRSIELRRPNELELTMVDGWNLKFGSMSAPLHRLVAEAHSHMPSSSRGTHDA